MTLYINQNRIYNNPLFTVLVCVESLEDNLKIKEIGNLVDPDFDKKKDKNKQYDNYYSVYSGSYITAKNTAMYLGRSTYDFTDTNNITNVISSNVYYSIKKTGGEEYMIYKNPSINYNISDVDKKPWYLYFEDRLSQDIKMIKTKKVSTWDTTSSMKLDISL